MSSKNETLKYNQGLKQQAKMRCAYADLICILGITILIIIQKLSQGFICLWDDEKMCNQAKEQLGTFLTADRDAD